MPDLIALTDCTRGEVDTRIAGLDPAELAEAALAEVVSRLAMSGTGDGLAEAVQFELAFDGKQFIYHLGAGEKAEISNGSLAQPWVVIRQDLAELLHTLFGPETDRDNATRAVLMKDEPGPASWQDWEWHARRRNATTAAHQVISACAGNHHDLTDLAVRFGSDKWGGHWYTPHYERYFAKFRDRKVTVLEIGIGGYQGPDTGGESLRMWKHYFRRGNVYGIDIFAKPGIGESRMRALQGSQNDIEFLRATSATYGPFDIVIDDGSHISADVITSFTTLFPLLREGGLYVVEDVQTSYWPGWGGSSEDRAGASTSMGFLKSLTDAINHRELTTGESGWHGLEEMVTAVHFHHNLVVVEKGRNAEQGSPSSVPRLTGPLAEMTESTNEKS
ncbi:MAG TPA: class I SAM-dependent methyltransferase [Pseudonocardiaceae bacterium]|nr:class I SAM-dependent methyltransferase [Pseudonocardiaceae bacterium]